MNFFCRKSRTSFNIPLLSVLPLEKEGAARSSDEMKEENAHGEKRVMNSEMLAIYLALSLATSPQRLTIIYRTGFPETIGENELTNGCLKCSLIL